MDASAVLISTACVAASTPVAASAVRAYRAFAGERQIICPETATVAVVRVKAARAVVTHLAGSGELALKSCSRWPAKKDCGQACAAQIARSPHGCRLPAARRSIPTQTPSLGRQRAS